MNRLPLLSLLSMLCCACATPTFTRAIEYGHADPARCLVVLVPDIQPSGERVGSFETNGFIEALHRERLSINIIAADAVPFSESSEYFFGGGSTKHLRDDILVPARALQRYEHVWMIGVSAGGFASLRYAAMRPGELDGVVAIEPFLRSPQDTIKAINGDGGLASWKPSGTRPQFEQLWRWVKDRAATPDAAPLVFAGWAIAAPPADPTVEVSRPIDALISGDALLGSALPQHRVFTVEGTHTFSTWKTLFERFIAQGEFKKQCGK